MKTIKKFKSINEFETERLYAIRLNANDLDKFITMHTDPVVMETLGGIRSAEKTQENLDWNLNQWVENGFGLWMFYLKETKEWIGRGGIRRINLNSAEEIEISYALMSPFWNKGYATEITKACIEIAFEVLRLKNVVCFTLTTNKPSQRVMKKSGFEYENDIVINYDGIDYPHVLYRMKNYRKAEIIPYNNKWPDIFRQEAKKIQLVLGNIIKKIHHIGSTAIPNMPAKPIIDMILECEDISKIEKIKIGLQPLGYLYFSRQIIPYRSFFTRRHAEEMGFHLHIYEQGDPQIKRHVNFRDYMLTHLDDAKVYAELKLKLAKQFKEDINNYVIGKDKLIQQIDPKAKLWLGKRNNYLPSNTGKNIKNLTDAELMKAITANFNVHMTYFSQYIEQIELIRIPGFTIVNSQLPDDTFNYVLDADFSASVAQNKIAEVTNYFKEKNITFSWWISPLDKPNNLTSFLEKNEYKNTENNIAMLFDLDSWEPPLSSNSPLRIIQAKDEKTLHDFALVLANDTEVFKTYFSWIAAILTDDDPIEYYVGYVDDQPVVRGLSCYYAGVVGLYWLSTALDERKKGYGTFMQEYQLKRAKELGYHVAVLKASSKGYPLYQHLGYKECGIFKEFKLGDIKNEL
ncbi:MAG: grpB 3 [Gammaproteobacteria bacterium]|jgi:GrpB-like predicted nucleotidyltransferase (UPF0157 family)/RimJ/RimL family protein N-acetyltransferase|nr:grpB 3 [Gammaproteobacteria bacterium]